MKARYYDPSVGRFISEDPKGFDGGDVNLMAYVENNPVNFVDPSGYARAYTGTKPIISGQVKKALPDNMDRAGKRIISSTVGGAIAGAIDGGLLGAYATPEFAFMGAVPGALLGAVTGSVKGSSTQVLIEASGYGDYIEDLPGNVINKLNQGIQNSSNPYRFGNNAMRCH